MIAAKLQHVGAPGRANQAGYRGLAAHDAFHHKGFPRRKQLTTAVVRSFFSLLIDQAVRAGAAGRRGSDCVWPERCPAHMSIQREVSLERRGNRLMAPKSGTVVGFHICP